jgi:hypothetical protein
MQFRTSDYDSGSRMISATEERNFPESRRDKSEETAVQHLTLQRLIFF